MRNPIWGAARLNPPHEMALGIGIALNVELGHGQAGMTGQLLDIAQ